MDKKITPCIWFNTQAEEAVALYTSLFEDSKTGFVSQYDAASAEVSGQPKGSVLTVDFELAGEPFLAMNGGPAFPLNPSVSFFVSCDSEEDVDQLYAALAEGGSVLMPLQEYPFSKKFAWVNDTFDVSWQLNFAEAPQKIRPCIMYVGDQAGRAEEAMNLYTSLFPDSAITGTEKYTAEDGDTEGTIKHGTFHLGDTHFVAMDSSLDHKFSFNESMSFMVVCDTQEEVDYYWNGLIAGGGAESQCGWLKDPFGVSWQIVPRVLNEMFHNSNKEKAERAMKAMLTMQKLVIADLEKAFNSKV